MQANSQTLHNLLLPLTERLAPSRARTTSMWRILIVLGVLTATLRPALAGAACLEYEIVSLSGRLVRQTYPGPPDFESMTKGDEPQVIWVLLLDRHLCVGDPDPRVPKEYYETEVQLVLAADQYRRYQNFLGERIIATGELLHGGARYDKRLVLAASEIKKAPVLP
jgi:hypothetical protein